MKIRNGLQLALFIAAIGSLSAFSRAAATWTVLDDFSGSSSVTNYIAYDSDTATGRDVVYGLTNGQLKAVSTIIRAGYAGGFWWNRGEVLKPGDSVKVSICPGAQNLCGGFRFSKSPFGKALTAGDNTSSGSGTIAHGAGSIYATNTCWINVYQRTGESLFQLTAGTGGTGQGGTESDGTWLLSGIQPATNDFFTLVVTRGEGEYQNVLTWSFDGTYLVGNRGSFLIPEITENEALYFAMNLNGSSANGRFENLSYATWTVLDDFSSSALVTNYIAYDSDTNAGRDVVYGLSNGQLKPINTIIRAGYAGGFWWTGGEVLEPGDSVKVGIRLGATNLCGGFRFSKSPFGKSLTAGDNTSSSSGTIAHGAGSVYSGTTWVNVYQCNTNSEFQLTVGSGGTGQGGVVSSGTWLIEGDRPAVVADFFNLVVTRGEGLNQNILTWSFEGNYLVGNKGSVSVSGLTEGEGLYFAMNLCGSCVTGRFDNLAFKKKVSAVFSFPPMPANINWAVPGCTNRIIIGIPDSPMLDARNFDERPAIVGVDFTNVLSTAGITGKKPDLSTLQLVAFDIITGNSISFTNNALQKTSGRDRPVRWYDDTIPFNFPDFSDAMTTNGTFSYNYLDRWGYFYETVGDWKKGRIGWVHTQYRSQPSYYAAYFNLMNETAAPSASEPRGMIGDGINRTEAVGDTGTGQLQTRVTLDDWNGDGLVDIIAGCARGQIVWWPNIGTANSPEFAYSRMIFMTNGMPLDVGMQGVPCVVDWDGDGKKDLIVSSLYEGLLSFFKNTGANTNRVFSWCGFLKTNDTGMIKSPYSPCPEGGPEGTNNLFQRDYYSIPIAVDWNGDGDLDLLTGSYVTGQISLYKNTGSRNAENLPILTYEGQITTNGFPLDVGWGAAPAVGDIDGDGDIDLISGLMTKLKDGINYQPGENFLRYFKNTNTVANAAPKLAPAPMPVNTNFPALALGTPVLRDFDADGDLDLVVSAGLDIYFITNIGNATNPVFDAANMSVLQTENGSSPLPMRGIFQDINGDGHPDIVDGTSYSTNTATGYPFRFAESQSYLPAGVTISHASTNGDGWRFSLMADADDDGDKDILFGDYDGQIWFHENWGGTNGFDTNGVCIADTTGTNIQFVFDNGGFMDEQGSRIMFACANFTGSTNKDIILRYTDGEVKLFEFDHLNANGVPVMKPGIVICTGVSRGFVYAVDWNGDGTLDVYLPGSATYDTVLLNTGVSTNWEMTVFERPGIPVEGTDTSSQPVDLNEDGDADILITNGYRFTSLFEKTFLKLGYAEGQIIGTLEQKP